MLPCSRHLVVESLACRSQASLAEVGGDVLTYALHQGGELFSSFQCFDSECRVMDNSCLRF